MLVYFKVTHLLNLLPTKEINVREGVKFQNDGNYRVCYTKKNLLRTRTNLFQHSKAPKFNQ